MELNQEYTYPIQDYVIIVKRGEFIVIKTADNKFLIELNIQHDIHVENIQNRITIKGIDNTDLSIINNPQQEDCKIYLQNNQDGDVYLLAKFQFAPIQLGIKLIEIGNALAQGNPLPQGFDIAMEMEGGKRKLKRKVRKTRKQKYSKK